METSSGDLGWLIRQPLIFPLSILVIGAVVVVALSQTQKSKHENRPPHLPDRIPFLSNGYQYMTDMKGMMTRASGAMAKTNIVGFRVGPEKFYFITGARFVQAMFRPTTPVSPDRFFHMVIKNLWNITPKDFNRFFHDKSGRGKVPIPGTEHTPEKDRYMAAIHTIQHNYILQTKETNVLGINFQRFFDEEVEQFPVGQWATVRVHEFSRARVTWAAVKTVAGRRVCERNPDFVRLFWDFDRVAGDLVWGLPEWLNPSGHQRRRRFLDACRQYIVEGEKEFDWNGPDVDADWEPVFGSRLARGVIKWMKGADFDLQSISGCVATMVVFGMNANTTPIISWSIMHVIQDPALFQALRQEVSRALVTDPQTGRRSIDIPKMLTLPLLQSVYIEALRLHVSMNVTREVIAPMKFGEYQLEKGAVIQACTEISRTDDAIWGAPGHPASEFWAERHLKYVEETDETGQVRRVPQFSMAGRTNDFYVYGGGVAICPGRNFAKQEIMLVVAILVSRFDIAFVEWVNHDGSPSDRAAENDPKYSGGASQPPDRDMKVLFKRLW